MSAGRVGEFELIEKIGRGATADVWRARQAQLRLDVAVKLFRERSRWEGEKESLFSNELRAAAALRHPQVAVLLDYGTVSGDDLVGLDGEYAGAPYLVMEYASAGTLASCQAPLTWRQTRSVLDLLLDALAHAHARGVVHRDLKPANILLCSATDARPGLKLTDFGLADVGTGSTGSDERVAGSPGYMAPEQFHARPRDYGPWTDLYAVGCMAFEFVTGSLPYRAKSLRAFATAHQSAPIPTLGRGAVEVPAGLEVWIASLMAKCPADRFRNAADARWALRALDPEVDVLPPSALVASVTRGSDTAFQEETRGGLGAVNETRLHEHNQTLAMVGSTLDDTGETPGTYWPETGSESSASPQPVPVVSGWEVPEVREPVRLVGAGIRLLGLREPPFVGRGKERETLWRALRATRTEVRPRTVVIRGPSGAGKSRLARWVCERASELGAAQVLVAPHSPDRERNGLRAMLESRLVCGGLDLDAMLERLTALQLRGTLPPEMDLPALASLLTGADNVLFDGTNHRLALVDLVVDRVVLERPTIVWIDDAQWGGETLEWAARRAAKDDSSVLFITTVRDEAVDPSSREYALLRELARSPSTTEIELKPLTLLQQLELVEHLLGLERSVAVRLAEKSAGNPLFAVQLVTDWVRRGALMPGETGLTLAGPEPEIPLDMRSVWSGRVERVAHLDPQLRDAMEIAAALGQDVEVVEWFDACRRRGLSPQRVWPEVLCSSGLAYPTGLGFRFSHGMLRECLEAESRAAERWGAHNRACADAVRALAEEGTDRDARQGRFLLESGAHSAAIPLLWRASDALIRESDWVGAHMQLNRVDAALEQLGASSNSRERVENDVRRARLYAGQRDDTAVLTVGEPAASLAARRGWRDLAALACEQVGAAYRTRSRFDDARDWLGRAVRGYRSLKDRRGLARTERLIGWVDILQGRIEDAEKRVLSALAAFEETNDVLGTAQCHRSLGDIARLRGDFELAKEAFERSLVLFEEVGYAAGLSECVHGLAEVQRYSGDLDAAAENYRRSIEIQQSVGSTRPAIPTLNLGLCELARKDYPKAQEFLSRALVSFDNGGQQGYAAVAHCCLLPATAGSGDLQSFDAHLEAALVGLVESDFVDPDIAEAAELASRLLGEDEHRRAAQVRDLAISQWSALGRTDRVESLQQL